MRATPDGVATEGQVCGRLRRPGRAAETCPLGQTKPQRFKEGSLTITKLCWCVHQASRRGHLERSPLSMPQVRPLDGQGPGEQGHASGMKAGEAGGHPVGEAQHRGVTRSAWFLSPEGHGQDHNVPGVGSHACQQVGAARLKQHIPPSSPSTATTL